MLVDHGFRLPSAMDNRPLKFEEFEELVPQVVRVSHTRPMKLEQADGVVVEQIIRPTGLLDPTVEVRRPGAKWKIWWKSALGSPAMATERS